MQVSYLRRSMIEDKFHGIVVRAPLAAVCLLIVTGVHASPPAEASFDVVATEVERYMATQADYRPGDLVRRSQIEAVLKNLASAGWKVDDAERLVELGLPDGSFLVRELSSPAGRKFMRKVGAQPGGFSRLDRLSTIPRGEQTIRDLIRAPNGSDLITYLATTKGGHNLGRKMAGVRNGVDLNKPTGRIYTVNDLIAALKKAHEGSSR